MGFIDNTEAVLVCVLEKKLIIKILQYSQENTYVGVTFW